MVAHELGFACDRENTPRPPSIFVPPAAGSSTTQTKSGRFFRPGGAHSSGSPPPPPAAEVNHRKSLDKLRITFGFKAAADVSAPSTLSD